MKLCLLLVTGLILVGCGRQEQNNREVLAKLETIQSELATNRAGPVRWAFANKREIESAIFKWSRDKMEANKKSEGLAPEVEEKVHEYERLQIDAQANGDDETQIPAQSRRSGTGSLEHRHRGFV
jgi:hypothetical protein